MLKVSLIACTHTHTNTHTHAHTNRAQVIDLKQAPRKHANNCTRPPTGIPNVRPKTCLQLEAVRLVLCHTRMQIRRRGFEIFRQAIGLY